MPYQRVEGIVSAARANAIDEQARLGTPTSSADGCASSGELEAAVLRAADVLEC
jgi:hypothetical protein